MRTTSNTNSTVAYALLSVCGMLLLSHAQAAVLGTYDFNNAPLGAGASWSASYEASGIDMGNLTLKEGVTGEIKADFWGDKYLKTTGWPSGTPADPSESMAFTIKADSGSRFHLYGLSFDSWAGFFASAKLKVAVEGGGKTEERTISMQPFLNPLMPHYYWHLPDLGELQEATFTFYGYKATGWCENGVLDFDNVRVCGSVVPEPYQYGLAGMFALAAFAGRDFLSRKRAKK